jgi:hypothetical protein
MVATKNLGGRPVKYHGSVKEHIVQVIRENNMAQAVRILNAVPGTQLAMRRDLRIIPAPLGITYPTIMRFSREAGLEPARRGAPKKI